jgi:hypothetical protein
MKYFSVYSKSDYDKGTTRIYAFGIFPVVICAGNNQHSEVEE